MDRMANQPTWRLRAGKSFEKRETMKERDEEKQSKENMGTCSRLVETMDNKMIQEEQ